MDRRQNSSARSQLKLAIEDTLDTGLPRACTPELYRQKCSAVFEHADESCAGRGAAQSHGAWHARNRGGKGGTVPEICRFLGIVSTMYFNDHAPPHFHVRYEDFRAIVGIDPLELREGRLPPRVLGLVIEWAELHQDELLENWTSLTASGTFKRIEPLV